MSAPASTAAPREAVWINAKAPVIQGRTMRPMSGGSILLCRDLGITFLETLRDLPAAGEAEFQRQIFTFLFIHGYTPPGTKLESEEAVEAMLRIVRLPEEEFRAGHLIPWCMALATEGLVAQVLEWLAVVNRGTIAGVYEVVKKLTAGAEGAPPNSSSPPGSPRSR